MKHGLKILVLFQSGRKRRRKFLDLTAANARLRVKIPFPDRFRHPFYFREALREREDLGAIQTYPAIVHITAHHRHVKIRGVSNVSDGFQILSPLVYR